MFILPIALFCVTFFGQYLVLSEKLENFYRIKGINYQKEYDRLNSLLEENVASNDVEANMEFAIEDFHERTLHGASKNEANFLDAYRLFTALLPFGIKTECTRENLYILFQNYRAIGMQANKNIIDEYSGRRIEEIFANYAMMYSRKCQSIYPALMREKLYSVNLKQMVLINQLTAFVLNKHITSLGENSATELFKLAVNTIELFPKLGNTKFIFEALENQVLLNSEHEYLHLKPRRDYSSGKYSLDEKEFGKLFTEYLISPCRGLLTAFGRDVFGPANFLASWQHVVMKNELDYYRKWLSYNICEVLLVNRSNILSATSKFASTLRRENSLKASSLH